MTYLQRLKGVVPTLGRGALIGLVVILASSSGLLETAERWDMNLFFSLRGPIPPKSPIIIVSIAEDSFDEFNLAWPWPRALHADLLDRLREGQPAAIGFDIAFPEPSSRGPEDDRLLAEALGRAGNVVLVAPITTVVEPAYTKEDMNAPIQSLLEPAAGFGYANFILDDDAFVRTATVTRKFQEENIPSFASAMIQAAQRAGIQTAFGKKEAFLINYRGGPNSFPTIPYYQIVRGEVTPDTFRGKIVLVGATTPVLHDLYPTPFATHGDMSGVELQANVLETILQNFPLERAPRSLGLILALAASIAAVWLPNRFRPLTALGIILAIAAVYGVVTYSAFVWGRVVMETSIVSLALVLGYSATVIENYMAEQKQRAMLMQLFSKHVSPEVAKAIWAQRDLFLSGGRLRAQKMTTTVLFTDLKGFTKIAEKMDTEGLLNWINMYLEAMVQIIMQHGGTVDDYFGDAIKANFGVPFQRETEEEIARDAANAVECALAMRDQLKRLNDTWAKESLPPVGMRVGIFTGELVAGCVGSAQRLKYTTIGDTVNTASRLESFEKDLEEPIVSGNPCRILIGASTRAYLADRFWMRPVGTITFKGKETGISVFSVLGRNEEQGVPDHKIADLRKAIRVPVMGQVTVSHGFHADVFIADLSVGGLSVSQLPREATPGKPAQLTIALPGISTSIRASGIVKWAAQDKAGFAFYELEQQDKIILEEFVGQQR